MLRHKSLHPLSHQHHNGLALGVMARRALAQDPSPAAAARQSQRVLERFELEIKNHFELEEELLFPAIEAALGPHELVRALLAEHRELERRAARLREAPEDAGALLAFLDLLRDHIRREENELFEEAQTRLDPAELDRLGAAFEARAVRVCLEP
jgi:hemerythrin-like domain-containing protein